MPLVRRSPDGTQSGAEAHDSQVMLYDVTGGYRFDLIALRCKVRASQGMDLPSWCPQAKAKR